MVCQFQFCEGILELLQPLRSVPDLALFISFYREPHLQSYCSLFVTVIVMYLKIDGSSLFLMIL